MIKIFFKTIWNQRSRNLLIYIEMFIIYLVLSNLTIYTTELLSVLKIRNCYNSENVVLAVVRPKGSYNSDIPNGLILNDLKRSLSASPLVETVSVSRSAIPYIYSLSTSTFRYNKDNEISTATRYVDIEYADALSIDVLKGRWFNKTDIGKRAKAVLVDEIIEKEDFDGNALGKRFGEDDEFEIIGVVNAFKRDDIEKPYKSTFFFDPLDIERAYYSGNFLIKVKPGKVNEYLNEIEENIFSVLSRTDWTIGTLNTLELMRAEQNTENGFKRLIGILIAIFIIINILLGIIGILWYNVNLRIHEIGIKRAIGNYSKKIIRQIIAENIIMAILGALPVVILLAQLPGIRISELEPALFMLSIIISLAILIILVIICSWIPAKIASQIQPANALKYE